jgi:nucleolar GTP-binding protein
MTNVKINTYLGGWGFVASQNKRIPTILTADELLSKAFHHGAKITVEGNDRQDRTRRTAASRITASGDVISSTLQTYVRAFPSMEKREDFMMELLDLLVGLDKLKQSLGALSWCSHKVLEMRKEYGRRVKNAANNASLEQARKEYYGRVSSLVHRIEKDLELVGFAREQFKKLPTVETDVPTAVVAGFPNVGKSQLVDRISTAKPVIAPYPFTTQGITVGHFASGWRRFQVIDTPGLLDRELEDRNQIERQAVLALKYLADVVVFVLDPSETSGYLIEKQLRLLASVEQGFKGIPFIEVENKVDIVKTDSARIKMSALTGEGVEELKQVLIDELKKSKKGTVPTPVQLEETV